MTKKAVYGWRKESYLSVADAHTGMAANNIAASMTGCAGQRCMAASAMVGVGEIDHIVEEIKNEAAKIIPGENLGAVISKEEKSVLNLIFKMLLMRELH